MTRDVLLAVVAFVTVAVAHARPAEKAEPVADGFVDWSGIDAKNYVAGREICASDLRHKATVFVVIEKKANLREQLSLAARLAVKTYVKLPESSIREWELPRDSIMLLSCRREVGFNEMSEALSTRNGGPAKAEHERAMLTGSGCSVYVDASYAGMPDTVGKSPYAIVMGPTGTDPVWHGALTDETAKSALAALDKAQKEVASMEPKWCPFFGTVGSPKFHLQLGKALEKGKAGKGISMDSLAKSILSSVTSKDAEKSHEAQILFDAINQTRDDLLLKIELETFSHPHVALADMRELAKYWPDRKKSVEKKIAPIVKAHPEVEFLSRLYAQTKQWSDSEFRCKSASGEKKIAAELAKAKKTLEKVKESSSISIQNAAASLDARVDELLTKFSEPTKR